jgi:RimJ/RimL family protein N-acetyltransferase
MTRLVLEPVSPDLAAAVIRGDVSALRPGAGWPHADTLDALRIGVAHGALIWLVVLDGLVIGDCGTHRQPDERGAVEIGFGLAAPYRGRGLGRELVATLVSELAKQPGVRRLTAEVDLANHASRRALERAGFRQTRVDGAHTWYALDVE